MHKTLGQICALVLGLASLVYAQPQFPFVAETVKDAVNLRAGQSTNFEKIAQLPLGSQLVVLEQQFSWYKVRLPKDSKCFIHSKYIQVIPGSQGVVTGSRVNVRAAADTNAASLGQLTKDSIVTIVTAINDWYQIAPVDGLSGWIAIELVKPTTLQVPDPIPVEKFASQSVEKIEPVLPVASISVEAGPAPMALKVESPQMSATMATIEDKKEDVDLPEIKEEVTVTNETRSAGPSVEGQVLNWVGKLKRVRQEAFILKVSRKEQFYLDASPEVLKEYLNKRVSVQGVIQEVASGQPTIRVISIGPAQ